MPELPEVETVRAGLARLVVGARLDGVEIRDVRLTQPVDPRVAQARLEGECVVALDRLGKYLIFRFESGSSLLAHLRMTGSFLYGASGSLELDAYTRAVVKLDNGSDVVYRDVRRFGTWVVAEPGELEPYLAARLGVEPLTRAFTARHLAEQLATRRAPVKAVLLDQRMVAGLGNIYADEALWRARVHPLTPAREVGERDRRALHRAVRKALRDGIARQGATLRDYRAPDGRAGTMQDAFNVYGRDGEPCPRCGTAIGKIRAGGRGTWFCPRCQRVDGESGPASPS